jgi:hypothetical protein
MNRCGVRPVARLALGLLAALAGVAHATVADELCPLPDDPCVVHGAATVSAGSTLDFGARTLELAAGAVVSWDGDVTVLAGACDFRAGSVLRQSGVATGPHFLEPRLRRRVVVRRRDHHPRRGDPLSRSPGRSTPRATRSA